MQKELVPLYRGHLLDGRRIAIFKDTELVYINMGHFSFTLSIDIWEDFARAILLTSDKLSALEEGSPDRIAAVDAEIDKHVEEIDAVIGDGDDEDQE